jgi:glycosyltransferase involved in cell wall biosynthesis
MKILFVNLSALAFTVATPDHAPLGGSESAVCYLARQLARRGHIIALAANLPDGQGGIVEAVSHYPLATIKDAGFFAEQNFDVIVICNAPAAAAPLRALSPLSRLVLWAHVLQDQPSMQCLMQAQTRDALDAVVFVSSWQRAEVERAFGAFPKAVVIGNGIAPAFENMFASSKKLLDAKQNRAAYAATPFRGLSVLVRAMQGIDRDVKLDVFSSMKVYQAADDDYAALFAELGQNPAITCHGSVAQTELAARLRASAFLFYPCIFPETFCIGAAEAMAAGMKVVATRLGALEETTMGFADLMPIATSDGDALAAAFRDAMRSAIDARLRDPAAWAEEMFEQVACANENFSWAARAMEWEQVLRALF